MSDQAEYAGVAALAICEALLLALKDLRMLPDSEIVGILIDAAKTHENAAIVADAPADREAHRAVAALINGMIGGGYFAPG